MSNIFHIYDRIFKRILTINDRDIYHIEAQMTEDEEIVFRVFKYGFGHAYKNRLLVQGGETMVFPQPCVICLDEGKKEKMPDEYERGMDKLAEKVKEKEAYIQEQEARIQEQEAQIQNQNTQLNELRTMIETLSKQIVTMQQK